MSLLHRVAVNGVPGRARSEYFVQFKMKIYVCKRLCCYILRYQFAHECETLLNKRCLWAAGENEGFACVVQIFSVSMKAWVECFQGQCVYIGSLDSLFLFRIFISPCVFRCVVCMPACIPSTCWVSRALQLPTTCGTSGSCAVPQGSAGGAGLGQPVMVIFLWKCFKCRLSRRCFIVSVAKYDLILKR